MTTIEATNTSVTVTNTGIGGSARVGMTTIEATNTSVTVTNTGIGGSARAVINDFGTFTVTGGALTVAGDNSQIASGPVTIQGGTVCQVNGTTVVCP